MTSRETSDQTRRVVVTGMGAVTSLGGNVNQFWCGLLEGRSAGGRISAFDPTDYPSQIAAEIKDFDPLQHFDRKEVRRMDRFVQFGVVAAREALADSGLKITDDNADRVGVIIASGTGGLGTLSEQYDVLRDKGPRRVSPFLIPMFIIDLASGQVSIEIGAKGPNFAIVSACSSSAHAIGESATIIRRGEADVILSGGAEACIVPIAVSAFGTMHALTYRNNDPQHASRPFDKERDGFLIGEGAGILVLEELSHAQARGARILAELAGYAATGDASHITLPAEGGAGVAKSMTLALQRAGLKPEDVQYINAHGTSTPPNDKSETMAIKTVFGGHAYKVAISSTKSMVGHSLGATAAIEGIACVKTLLEGRVHPTINYEYPDPDCDLDYVPNVARDLEVSVALSNDMGFGGHNATLIFRRWSEGESS